VTHANGLWYIARLVPGTEGESLDAAIARTLRDRDLADRMPEGDATVEIPDASPGSAPVARRT
jgi:hypothetical protein